MTIHITEPIPGEKAARLVFGLEWAAYPVKGAREDRRRYADDFGATHYAETKLEGEIVAGFASPGKGLKLYSGAARIASIDFVRSSPAALVLLQDEHRVFLVYVVRGAIRNDEVLTIEEARARRQDIQDQCAKVGISLLVLGSGQAIGDVARALRSADLLAQKKVGRVRKLPMALPSVFTLGLLGVGMVLAAKVLSGALSSPQVIQHQTSWNDQYASLLRKTFAKQQPKASELGPLLLAHYAPAETNVDGWQFDKADCPASGHCSVTKTRNGGTFAEFESRASADMRPIVYGLNGETLSFAGVPIPKTPVVDLRDQKTWPTEQQFIAQVMSPPQSISKTDKAIDAYGYKVTLQPSKSLLPGAVPLNARGVLIREGEWKIEGFMWQRPLLERLPPNMALEHLSIGLDIPEKRTKDKVDIKHGVSFIANGKYYVVQ